MKKLLNYQIFLKPHLRYKCLPYPHPYFSFKDGHLNLRINPNPKLSLFFHPCNPPNLRPYFKITLPYYLLFNRFYYSLYLFLLFQLILRYKYSFLYSLNLQNP